MINSILLSIILGLFFSSAYAAEYGGIEGIDFELVETTVIPIPYWIDEPVDYSDILKVKFKITNKEFDNFVVYKDMFKIDLEDPSVIYREFSRPTNDFVVENYYPQYAEDFKIRFQDISISGTYDDCVLLNHGVPKNQTKELTVCFDIKRKWTMHPVNLTGKLEYYLVMMDNKYSFSCPNCERVKLTSKPIEEIDTQKEIVLVFGELTPLKQSKMGKNLHEISCKENYILLSNNEKPACVKPMSIQKLIQRGWVLVNPKNTVP